MAASIMRGSPIGASVKYLKSHHRVSFVPIRRLKYFFTFPVTPKDNAETNPLMRIEEKPQFSKITPGQIVRACAKFSLDYERKVDDHITSFEDLTKLRTFESVVAPLDALYAPVHTAISTADVLTLAKGTQPYLDAMNRSESQVRDAKIDIYTEEAYLLFKEVYMDGKDLTDEQKIYLELLLKECQRKGFELQGKPREEYEVYSARLKRLSEDFGTRARACKRVFAHTVTDRKIINELPKPLLDLISLNPKRSTSGPWKITLDDFIYRAYMMYCPDPEERRNIWYAYNNVSSPDFVPDYLDNHKIIDDIVRYRKVIAEILGYENFASLMIEHKMAGSVDTVLNMVEELKAVYLPQAEEEFKSVCQFALDSGFEEEMKLCDIPYYKLLQMDSLYNVTDVSRYFLSQEIVKNAMELVYHMFGIMFKLTENHHGVATNIFCFEAYDNQGNQLGEYYIDPMARADKHKSFWVERGTNRCANPQLIPYTYQSMDLDPRCDVMSWNEVCTFYLHFGVCVQQCVSKTSYNLLSSEGTEEDIKLLAGFLLRLFPMDPEYLQSISKDIATGQQLPMPVIKNMLHAEKHMAGYEMCSKLFTIAYDLEINLSHDNWYSTLENIWPLYMPLPLDKDDNHPCCDLTQFHNGLATHSYHIIWSEMVALEMFGAFKEAGSITDKEVIRSVGTRLRDTFFSQLGSVKAKELFRRFRGRDPSVEPLKAFYKK